MEACSRALELERRGDYEGARHELGDFWFDAGHTPNFEQLSVDARAALYLRVGSLQSSISGAVCGTTQKHAKAIIGRSVSLYKSISQNLRVADALGSLAICYWRERDFDHARNLLIDALIIAGDDCFDLRARLHLWTAIVERGAGNYLYALNMLLQSAPLFEASADEVVKGSFYHTISNLYLHLSSSGNDYLDRALDHYEAAAYWFEQAKHHRNLASVYNTFGFALQKAGQFESAHTYLDRARSIWLTLCDQINVAQVDDTRALAFLNEGRLEEAENAIELAVAIFRESHDKEALRAALKTRADINARRYTSLPVFPDNILRPSFGTTPSESSKNVASSLLTMARVIKNFKLIISDDSLIEAGIPEGHSISFVYDLEPCDGDLVAFESADGLLIMFYYNSPGGFITFEPANSEYPSQYYKRKDFIILGVSR